MLSLINPPHMRQKINGSSPTLFTLPSEFTALWNPDFNIYEDGRTYSTDFDITTLKPTGTKMYVSKTGDNTTGDGSIENPYRTGAKAYSEGADIVAFREGFYGQGELFGTNFRPMRNFAIESADGAGKAILTPAFLGLIWTQESAPNTNVWSTTVANNETVIDRANLHLTETLKDGVTLVPKMLTRRTSIALCQANPNSFFVSGTTLYVHTFNSRQPDTNILPFSTDNFLWFFDGTNQTVYFDGLEIWGRGGCRTEHTAVNTNTIAAKDSAFRFAEWTIGLARIQGTRNAYFINCAFTDHTTQDALGVITTAQNLTTRSLEVNCFARRCGNAGATNDNCFTSHTECMAIRLNPDGQSSFGPILADVQGAYTVNLGGKCGNSGANPADQANVAYQVGSLSPFAGNRPSKLWMKNCEALGGTWGRGQASGGEMYDYGGFIDGSSDGEYGTIMVYP